MISFSIGFEYLGVAGHRLLRVVDLLLDHLVADRARGFLQLARGVALVVRRAPGGSRLPSCCSRSADLVAQLVLLLPELAELLLALRAPACCAGCCTCCEMLALLRARARRPAARRSCAFCPALRAAFCCSSRCASCRRCARLLRLRAAVLAVGRRLARRRSPTPAAAARRPPDPGAAGPVARLRGCSCSSWRAACSTSSASARCRRAAALSALLSARAALLLGLLRAAAAPAPSAARPARRPAARPLLLLLLRALLRLVLIRLAIELELEQVGQLLRPSARRRHRRHRRRRRPAGALRGRTAARRPAGTSARAARAPSASLVFCAFSSVLGAPSSPRPPSAAAPRSCACSRSTPPPSRCRICCDQLVDFLAELAPATDRRRRCLP